MTRRQLLASAGALGASASVGSIAHAQSRPATINATTNATTQVSIPDDVIWRNIRDWGVEGRAFDDTENYFDRFTARAKGVVRPEVWDLSRDTAGMSVRFETDATDIFARYTLTLPELALSHMPASGASGLDLYGMQDNAWHWIGVARPTTRDVIEHIGQHIAPGRRVYQVNLPLYNGVKSIEIGMSRSAAFSPISPRKEKPILFYGTSITQGACASRPGMAFVAILGRRLNRPMLNFGFSGNGKMEVEVARFLAELDPTIFVLDCVANMADLPGTERTEAVVKVLRERHPTTPILLLDARVWANASLVPFRREDFRQRSDQLRNAYANLQDSGVPNLHFRDGDDLIGFDGEATVDGSHPTDLGMMRYADALEPDLRRILTLK